MWLKSSGNVHNNAISRFKLKTISHLLKYSFAFARWRYRFACFLSARDRDCPSECVLCLFPLMWFSVKELGHVHWPPWLLQCKISECGHRTAWFCKGSEQFKNNTFLHLCAFISRKKHKLRCMMILTAQWPHVYTSRVANPLGLTRSVRVLTYGLQAPGLVLQSPGC